MTTEKKEYEFTDGSKLTFERTYTNQLYITIQARSASNKITSTSVKLDKTQVRGLKEFLKINV